MDLNNIAVTVPLGAIVFFFSKEVYFWQKNRNGTSPYAKLNKTLEKMTDYLEKQLVWNERHSIRHEHVDDKIKDMSACLRAHETYEEKMLVEIQSDVRELRAR